MITDPAADQQTQDTIADRPEFRSATSNGRIGPCVYPGCCDPDGNPNLTQQVICEYCRKRYRRLLNWLVQDYAHIRQFWPTPAEHAVSESKQRTTARVYGHPAEWASDTLALIADVLNGTEHALRDWLGHGAAVHPGHREHRRLALAYRYLTATFDDLCTWDYAEDTAAELSELHGRVRAALGQSNPALLLPTPCPACDLLTLTRTIDQTSGDNIACGNCGCRIPEQHYGLYTRMLVDEYIDVGDTCGEAA